ncbi:MAG: hypothetical protein CMD22_06200 [Flavobacteriales bacterium]|nr:hypothetical protein [Flavobacteriales bacterium]|tara:strand:+ start:5113 stop:6897 length:1785 start_codon:yes stop_codon:yes gene_type:complete
MKKSFIILLCIASPLFNYSQTHSHLNEKCGTEKITEILEKKYPEYKKQRSNVNKQTENWLNKFSHQTKSIITIPVVVHVVWNTNQQNISDAQINSQIDVLNDDYRRTNIDAINTPSLWNSIASDTEIEFCLANTDPNGSVTTGITRTQTSETSFSIQNDGMKSNASGGIDPWPQDDYLNIWVCNLTGGILGYATPPSSFNNPSDGVVVGYRYFGTIGSVQAPYNKGRTTTHEVGHWLNLDHVWGSGNCGNDNVNDTPTQEEANYSCPSFPHNPNSCNTTNSNGDMFMNYMDYTNDACMNMFTNGQKNRMISAINQYRPNLLSHNLCSNTPPTPSWNCVNGNCIDPNNGNGTYTDYNNCIANCDCGSINIPIVEDFQVNLIPNSWTIINDDGDKTWEINELAGYNSSKSIYINNAEYAANGTYDDLILPVVNLSNVNAAYLNFHYAYTLWTNPNLPQNWSDTLIVYISEDCGITWTKIWEKAGTNLTTTNPVYHGFNWIPNGINDWKFESVSLLNYINQDDVVVKFRNVNQYENNLFIDNININTIVTNIDKPMILSEKLLKIVDVLGRETIENTNTPLFYIFDDGTVEKRIILE